MCLMKLSTWITSWIATRITIRWIFHRPVRVRCLRRLQIPCSLMTRSILRSAVSTGRNIRVKEAAKITKVRLNCQTRICILSVLRFIITWNDQSQRSRDSSPSSKNSNLSQILREPKRIVREKLASRPTKSQNPRKKENLGPSKASNLLSAKRSQLTLQNPYVHQYLHPAAKAKTKRSSPQNQTVSSAQTRKPLKQSDLNTNTVSKAA